MTDRTLVGMARAAAVSGGILGVAGVLWIVLQTDHRQPWLEDGSSLSLVIALSFAIFVWLVAPQEPRNAVVWVMAVSGLGAGVYLAAYAAATMFVSEPSAVLGDAVVPAELPVPATMLVALANAGVYVALYAWLTFGLLLFPDGRLPSSRWRWLSLVSILGLGLLVIGAGWEYRPSNSLPVNEDSVPVLLGASIVTLGAILSMVALFLRFRRSTGVVRDQMKWVGWGAAVMVPWFVAAFVVGGSEFEALVLVPLHLAVGVMLVAYGIAIGRYRLFDVDVVISKTVTYSLLAVVLGLLYGAAVLGYIQLFGDPAQRGGDLGLALPIGATALVVLLFEPLRVRLQRLANRIAFGKRAAPHELLSELTTRFASSAAEDGLSGLAELLRSGTGAENAQIWVRVGKRLRLEAASPAAAESEQSHLTVSDDLPATETQLTVPVSHGEELLGAIGINKPRSHPVTPADENLLRDMAAGAGLLLRNRRLNAELLERAVEVQRSRRRLIEAHDMARRRLERNLHDGAQQQVVALKVRLGLAKAIAEKEGLPELGERVSTLSQGLEEAIDSMRAIARGIYPPLLESEGLVAALVAASRTIALQFDLHAEDLPRFPMEIEQTAYFCAMAALTRAREAGASSAQVTLTGEEEALVLTVSQDGGGFGDVTELADRAEAFGGSTAVTSPPAPATVRVVLPVLDAALEAV